MGYDRSHESKKKNNVPEWYIESCENQVHTPKAHAAAYVMMVLRVA